MTRKEHWERIYSTKSDAEVSWTQREPRVSLELIHEATPAPARVIDVGGGTSVLHRELLAAGYALAVLDISERAIVRARERLADLAERVRWIVTDITEATDLGTFDVWHDRAVFHFLVDSSDRARYVKRLAESVPVGGHAILGTFALEGPEKCSGLPVVRYGGEQLAKELGSGFRLVRSVPEIHTTPAGKTQSFQYGLFRRIEAGGSVPASPPGDRG